MPSLTLFGTDDLVKRHTRMYEEIVDIEIEIRQKYLAGTLTEDSEIEGAQQWQRIDLREENAQTFI